MTADSEGSAAIEGLRAFFDAPPDIQQDVLAMRPDLRERLEAVARQITERAASPVAESGVREALERLVEEWDAATDYDIRVLSPAIDDARAALAAAAPPAGGLDWGRLAYVLGLIGPVDMDDTEDAFVAYAEDIRERYLRDDLEDDPQYADYAARLAGADRVDGEGTE